MDGCANNYVCRLCAELGICISIFSELGKSQRLQEKIAQCQSLTVLEHDDLPTSICLDCLAKLNTCYEWQNVCSLAQAKLKGLTSRSISLSKVPPKQLSNGNTSIVVHSDKRQEVVAQPDQKQLDQVQPQIQQQQVALVMEVAKPVQASQQVFLYPQQVVHPPTEQNSNVLSTSFGVGIKYVQSLGPSNSVRLKKKEIRTVCQYCRKWFPRAIIKHHENLHIKGGVFFTCINCNDNFRTKQEFSTHNCD